MSPEMPLPSSTTSMHTSSSTLTVTLSVVAPECRTALLTASRTSFDVVGQCSIDHRQRAGELNRGAQIGAGFRHQHQMRIGLDVCNHLARPLAIPPGQPDRVADTEFLPFWMNDLLLWMCAPTARSSE